MLVLLKEALSMDGRAYISIRDQTHLRMGIVGKAVNVQDSNSGRSASLHRTASEQISNQPLKLTK